MLPPDPQGLCREEVGFFVKPTDIGPSDLLGTSSLFDLTRVCSLSQVKLVLFLFD